METVALGVTAGLVTAYALLKAARYAQPRRPPHEALSYIGSIALWIVAHPFRAWRSR